MESTAGKIGLGAFIALMIGAGVFLVRELGFAGTEVVVATAFVLLGSVVIRFGAVQLRGDAQRTSFLVSSVAALLASVVFVLSDHMALLFLAWFATSLAVDRLLRQNPARQGIHAAADGKFLASRVGDLFLLAAIGLAVQRFDTWSVRDAVQQAISEGGSALHLLGLLVVFAALAKSAQVPFHGWLPRTIEAPTAVSALLHAGIVNAGAVLLLKFAPVLAQSQLASSPLVVIGCLSVFTGLSAAWTRPDIKGALAWSTVAQMGFVMVEVGLGAYSIALVHLIGHGLYKSWAFLTSGEVKSGAAAAGSTKPISTALRDAALAAVAMAALAFVAGGNPTISDWALLGAVAVALGSWNTGIRHGALVIAGFAVALETIHLVSHQAIGSPLAWSVHPLWTLPVLVLPAATLVLHFWIQSRVSNGGNMGKALYLPMSRGWYLERPVGRATRGLADFRRRFNTQPEKF